MIYKVVKMYGDKEETCFESKELEFCEKYVADLMKATIDTIDVTKNNWITSTPEVISLIPLKDQIIICRISFNLSGKDWFAYEIRKSKF